MEALGDGDVMANFEIAQLDETPAVDCPCGQARRAFADLGSRSVASVHLTDIHSDSRVHYHRQMTEVYVVLEGHGEIELDGERHPLRPMTAVMIHPGCRHRATGNLRILNIPIPAFDPADEHFD